MQFTADNINLKKANVEDLELVVDFDRRLNTEEHVKLNRAEKISIAIQENQCYIILANNVPVGFVLFDYRFFGQGWIELIIIDEMYRGKEIGVHAMNLICEQSQMNKIFTSTNSTNSRMQRALSKAGFTFAGEVIGLDKGDPELFYFRVK